MSSSNAECGALLPQLAARLFAQFLERLPPFLAAHGYGDIRTTHVLNVFLHLNAQGASPAELARKAGMTAQSMGELIAYLDRRGYIARVPDPTDGRVSRVVYAPRGLEAAANLMNWMTDLDANWARELGSASSPEQTRASLLSLAEFLESDPTR